MNEKDDWMYDTYLKSQRRVAELEAALTDALYAWGLILDELNDEVNYHRYKEAEERIQRARLALPKTGAEQPAKSEETK